MPYITKEQRAQGPWVSGGLPGTETPDTPAESGPCGLYEGGDRCGVRTEKRYLPGWRCPLHTPAALAGRLETTPDPDRNVYALRSRRISTPDQTRYGPVTPTA